MDANETHLGTTGIIWVAYTVIMVAAMAASNNMSGGMLVMLVIIFTVAALSATSMIWKNRDMQSIEKVKRRSRVDRVMDEMNDQELSELRARIGYDTYEDPVALDELLKKNRA